MGLPVSNQLIITRAKFIVKTKNINTKCIFSSGWLKCFKKRYNIVNRKSGSKLIRNDDNKLDILIDFVKEVNEKIESDTYNAIINIDETGLYYDSKIEHTLDVKGTRRIEIKSTGREKQRITVILGINLLNNIRMKPLIILKGKTNRCINNIPLNKSYKLSFQDNAWCDEDQFIKFISSLPKNKKILLLYDNFGAHKTEKVIDYINDKYPLIDVLWLPTNTTSILQPLDVGINKPFKTHIKNEYINWLVNNFNDEDKTLPELGKTERNKLLVKWISKSWKKIDNEIISNSFEFCGYGIPDNVEPKWVKYYVVKK